MSKRCSISALFLMSILTFSSLVFAGDLEPSSPPASTMKSLNEVEPRTPISSLPYTISSSGSYYITGNLSCSDDVHAITINANDVSIDLKGFTISGRGAANTGIYNGIYASGKKNVEIRNGSVKGFYQGIWIYSTTSNAIRIIEIRSSSNSSNGILISGSQSLIKECIAFDNGSTGINGGKNATVLNCIAYNNGASGIYGGNDSLLKGNRAYGNTQHGITTGNSCRITDNTTNSNTMHGIAAGKNCTISDNSVDSNTRWGIYTSDACKINDNHVTNNNPNGSSSYGGIWATQGCLVKENMCYANKAVNIFTYNSGNLIEANFITNGTKSNTEDPATAINMYYNGNYCVGNRVYNFLSAFTGISFNNNTTATTGGNYEFIYAP